MKKQKQTRETRAAYRARTRRVTAYKARAKKSRPKKVEAEFVPWAERIAPTDEQVKEWDAWLNEREPDFEIKYPGRFLAIWDKKIIATGSTRAQLYARVHQTQPKVIPLVTFIPSADEVIFIPSNFPVGWYKDKDDKPNG